MLNFNTNAEVFKSEMEDVIKLFPYFDLSINHTFVKDGNLIKNTVTVNGKEYNYETSVCYDGALEEKRLVKRELKLSVYKALSDYVGISMPWGALTGIRPTKLAYQSLEKTGEFKKFFTEKMFVSKEKTDLIEKIINAQGKVYQEDDNNVDLFISLPFCPSKCSYCSFITSDITKTRHLLPDYIEALRKEIESGKNLIKNLRSIYIGGGTPVAVPKEYLIKVLETVNKVTDGKAVEYTVEAGRPDAIDDEALSMFSDFGVTRLCLNPQTFNDKTLKIIGRSHTSKDIYDKFESVSKKFAVNMDLIAGLPEETFSDFKFTVDKTLALCPDNITVHTLCLKKGSRLKETTDMVSSYLSANGVSDMVEYSHKALQGAGYIPYYLYRQKYMAGNLENTGYSLKDKICVYNVDIMEEISQNVAFGANAVSKRVINGEKRIERYGTPKDILTYIKKIDEIIEEKDKLFK